MRTTATIRPPGTGEENRAFGLPRTFKVVAADVDGACTVFEETVPAQAGPPLHVHHREHEVFAVLEGEVRFHCEGEETRLGTGGVIAIPPGARHTFRNDGRDTARVLVSLTPGGAEGFFRAVEAEGLTPQNDMARIAEIGAEYGLEFVGPPLT